MLLAQLVEAIREILFISKDITNIRSEEVRDVFEV